MVLFGVSKKVLYKDNLCSVTTVIHASVLLKSDSTNLVDPASSHMLVSKIKPCKSKYKLIYTAKLRIAHYNSYNLHDDHYQMDIHGNSGANTC